MGQFFSDHSSSDAQSIPSQRGPLGPSWSKDEKGIGFKLTANNTEL